MNIIEALRTVTNSIKTWVESKFLKTTGGTLSGDLTIFTSAASVTLKAPDNAEGEHALARVYKNANADADYGLQLRDYARGALEANNSTIIMISDARSLKEKVQLVHQTNGANKYYKLYGEHNKPTLEELGVTVSTTDLTEGVSELETGKLYFVYE